MHLPRPPPPTRLKRLFSSFSLACFLTSTLAQTQPQPAFGISWASIANKRLMIQGGWNGTANSNQLFSLDLGIAWPASRPAFNQLSSNGAPAQVFSPAAFNFDSSDFLVINNHTVAMFHIEAGVWEDGNNNNATMSADRLAAALDPVSGIVYVPNADLAQGKKAMLQLDTSKRAKNRVDPVGNALLQNLRGFSVVWSSQRKSLLLFGGYGSDETMVNTLYEYRVETGWVVKTTSGVLPQPRAMHCMVETGDAQQMILFGGFTKSPAEQSFGDLYSLDMTTLTWTQLAQGRSDTSRTAMACASSGSMFIVWGGGSVSPRAPIASNVTLVFNLVSHQWQDTFTPVVIIPSGSGATPGPAPSNPSATDLPGGLSKEAVIGICSAGALVFIGLCAFAGFVFFRRRKGYQLQRASAVRGPGHGGSGGTSGIETTSASKGFISTIHQNMHKKSKKETGKNGASVPDEEVDEFDERKRLRSTEFEMDMRAGSDRGSFAGGGGGGSVRSSWGGMEGQNAYAIPTQYEQQARIAALQRQLQIELAQQEQQQQQLLLQQQQAQFSTAAIAPTFSTPTMTYVVGSTVPTGYHDNSSRDRITPTPITTTGASVPAAKHTPAPTSHSSISSDQNYSGSTYYNSAATVATNFSAASDSLAAVSVTSTSPQVVAVSSTAFKARRPLGPEPDYETTKEEYSYDKRAPHMVVSDEAMLL